MTEESDISLPSQQPRYCPVCGIRVAAKASECLMCGASLVEEEEPDRDEEKKKRRVPSWVGSLAVAVLSLVVLSAGALGLYTMLGAEPEPEATTAVTASPTSTPVPSSTPTETPVPTATPTPLPPRAHSVQEGETLSDIAALYDVAMDEILALNAAVDPELIRPGQVLLIPASKEAPGPSASGGMDNSGATSSGFLVHVVSSGETLSSIASHYDLSVSVIRAANDLAPDDETIRAGQSLVIPVSTPTPSPTPTIDPNALPTPVPRYAPPPLLYPADGAILADGAPVLLQWASVDILESDEWYELRLWQPGGVVSTTTRTRATAWRMPPDLLEKAAGEAPRFYWRVQVVREGPGQVYEEAGASATARSFVWEGTVPAQQSPTPSTP